ncbi:MAG: flagellar export protein FliJ [Oscillospiraceae bacterium]|nr:flagellar export protein FliJ [Oscillospiraceae bacterium]
MKRFKFELESVLKYRENTEKNEKVMLASLNARLEMFNAELSVLRGEYTAKAREFEEKSKSGVTVHDVRSNHMFLKNIDYGIELKTKEIEEQNKLVAKQTDVVVRAMQDTKMLDKLKEQKFKTHVKEERKEQEKFIEEFVSNKFAAAR